MTGIVSKKQLRQFGLLLGFVFPVIIGWLLPYLSGHHYRIWTLLIGVPFLVIGILRPKLLIYPFKGWMALGHFLGYINSKLILGLVFILVLLPISLIMKCFKYDPLNIRKVSLKSYRENKKDYKIDLTRIF